MVYKTKQEIHDSRKAGKECHIITLFLQYLWYTSDCIGILYVLLLALLVDLRGVLLVVTQCPHGSSHSHLARVGSDLVDSLVEGVHVSLQDVEYYSPDNEGCAETGFSTVQRFSSHLADIMSKL